MERRFPSVFQKKQKNLKNKKKEKNYEKLGEDTSVRKPEKARWILIFRFYVATLTHSTRTWGQHPQNSSMITITEQFSTCGPFWNAIHWASRIICHNTIEP